MRFPLLCPKLFSIWLPVAALLAWPALAQAQELVHFPANDADLTKGAPTQIEAYLFRPPGAGPFPAVVGLHGCGGLINHKGQIQSRETAWAQTLTAHGYVVLYPESFASRQIRGGCVGGTPTVAPWSERPRDAYGALLYLQSQPFVIADRIGVMGWSHGGGTVTFTIDKNTAARPKSLPKGDFRAAIAFYPGWCNEHFHGANWGTAIPTLVLQGASDDWTEAGPCQEVVARAAKNGSPIEITLYPGAYHDFDWPGEPVHLLNLLRIPPKTVHVGFQQEAHDAAVIRVPAFFDSHLKP